MALLLTLLQHEFPEEGKLWMVMGDYKPYRLTPRDEEDWEGEKRDLK